MPPLVNLTGRRFHRLVVIKRVDSGDKKPKWECKCDCGNTIITTGERLRIGETRSCGCLKLEGNNTKHGMATTRFHDIYRNMRTRCTNPNVPEYEYYGGRGITCDYTNFEDFMKDHYETYLIACKLYGEDQVTIERIDVNGNYTNGNITWIDRFDQQSNTRRNKWFKAISPTGEVYESNNQNEFARQHNLKQTRISDCLLGKNESHKGWTFKYI